MKNKFSLFLILMMSILATFIAGYIFSGKNNPLSQQALLKNSLVARFNKTDEKYVKPTGLSQLYPNEVSFPTLYSDDQLIFYMARSGEIRTLSVKNPKIGSTLVAKIPPNANYISWATNKSLIAGYPNGSIFYDLTSNFSKKYDFRIKNPTLNKEGSKIVYNYFDMTTGTGNITISDPKLQSYKNMLQTRFADWQMKWLDDKNISLLRQPTLDNSLYSQYLLNLDSANLQNIIDYRNNFDSSWSQNGQKLIYSYANPLSKNSGLYFMDMSVKKEISLDLSLDASRCVWASDNKTVYCANQDSFVALDTSLGKPEIEKVATTNDTSILKNAISLILTNAEDYIIFKNSQDAKLYLIELKK